MSPQAWQSWLEFIERSHSLDETRNYVIWEMLALILALKCVPCVQEEALSSETTLLVNKETRAPTEVPYV